MTVESKNLNSFTITFPRATWLTNINLFLQPVLPVLEYIADSVAESAKYMPLPNMPGSLLVPPKSSTTIFGRRRPLGEEIKDYLELHVHVQQKNVHKYMYNCTIVHVCIEKTQIL